MRGRNCYTGNDSTEIIATSRNGTAKPTTQRPATKRPATPKHSGRPLLTQREAAVRLGLNKVSKRPELTIRRMCRRGYLVGYRVSTWTMIDPDSVDRFLAVQTP